MVKFRIMQHRYEIEASLAYSIINNPINKVWNPQNLLDEININLSKFLKRYLRLHSTSQVGRIVSIQKIFNVKLNINHGTREYIFVRRKDSLGKQAWLRFKQVIEKSKDKRKCLKCKETKTNVKNGIAEWYRRKRGLLCKKCYALEYYYLKKEEKLLNISNNKICA